MFRSEVRQVLSNHQLSFDLHQSSAGSRKEKMELVRGESRVALGNVSWNRNRRPSQLTSECIGITTGKRFGGPVDVHHEIHCLLPCDQFPVRLSQ